MTEKRERKRKKGEKQNKTEQKKKANQVQGKISTYIHKKIMHVILLVYSLKLVIHDCDNIFMVSM